MAATSSHSVRRPSGSTRRPERLLCHLDIKTRHVYFAAVHGDKLLVNSSSGNRIDSFDLAPVLPMPGASAPASTTPPTPAEQH